MEKTLTSCFVICHIDFIAYTLKIIACMKMVFIDFLQGLKKDNLQALNGYLSLVSPIAILFCLCYYFLMYFCLDHTLFSLLSVDSG